jgi:hypothetical protein
LFENENNADTRAVWFVVWFMGLNAIFNNISVTWWRSVLSMEETGVPGENHQPAATQCLNNRNQI